MTLILGLNLSDRLYLASDTRITSSTFSSEGKVVSRRQFDSILKSRALWNQEKANDGNFLSLAVAGDVEMATFLYEGVVEGLDSRELSSDIRELERQIVPHLEKKLETWIIDLKKVYPGCDTSLLFAGTTSARRKIISKEKTEELVRLFKQSKEKSFSWHPNVLKELGSEGSFLYQINAGLIRDQGRTLLEALEETSIPRIPEHISVALQTEDGTVAEHGDSLIFAATIGEGGVIKKEKAEWGEMLAYGAVKKAKEQISDELLATFELSRDPNNAMPHAMEGAITTAEIMDLAKKNHKDTIGGTVVMQILDGKGIRVGGDGLRVEDGGSRIVAKIHGIEIPLMPFDRYCHLTRLGGTSERAEM